MSDLLFNETAELAIPASAKGKVYLDSADRYLKLKDSKGVITALGDRRPGNWVRNSGFWFAQRQTPGTLTTYSAISRRTLSADGWGITNENASAQYQRTDTSGAPESGLQGQFYGQFTKITATGKLVVTQVIEGCDTMNLRGRTVRVQFWAKQIVGAAPVLRLCLVQLNSAGTLDSLPLTYISAFGANGTDPTLGANLVYITPKSVAGLVPDNGAINGSGVDCTLSAVWQRFGAIFDVPSNCENLVVQIHGSAQFAAAAGFALSQVSLTDGYEVQAWSPLSRQLELERAIRFYCKTFNLDTAPVQNLGINTGELKWVKIVAAATASRSPAWFFPVRMRAAPTATTYNPAAANAQVRDETGSVDCSATAAVAGGEASVAVTATGNVATVAEGLLGVHLSCDAEL